VICASVFAAITFTHSYSQVSNDTLVTTRDSSGRTALEKRYNINDKRLPYTLPQKRPLLFLETPPNVSRSVIYDPKYNQYNFTEKVGALDYSTPYSMNLNEYKNYEMKSSKQNYWLQRSKSETVDRRSPLLKSINIGGETFDKIFGTSTINIVPQGSAELIFSMSTSKINNPNISERLRKNTIFDFKEKIQMNVTGSIGDKLKLGINYNTDATFDFENKTKLEYTGKEDEIIKKIEAGHVSLPLTGSLITGSQSLFGIKTELQFGKLFVTTVVSQQKGESSVIEVKGGAQQEEYELGIDQYDANKHFFLSQYFREHYEEALSTLPTITSNITITKLEVWVTNKSSNYENTRNIIAFMDLGEGSVYNKVGEFRSSSFAGVAPSNTANLLYNAVINNYNARDITAVFNNLAGLKGQGFYPGQDYEKVENARRLTEREYTLNERLGYISLNTALNSDEVLAVAFEYIMGGKTYRVGELSTSGIAAPQALVLKLIKPTNLRPKLPTWDLMMKNVYAIGAYQVDREDFELQVLYQDDKTGNAVNYIPEIVGTEKKDAKQILIRALSLDKVNSQNDPYPDGVFDYMEGVTINSSNGRVFFPTLEPFGETLRKYLENKGVDPKKYVFDVLYDSTQTKARLEAERNKFKIKGRFQSSSGSDISLNAMNVPQGSVVVTAGGMKLTENVDYTVDYMLGRVKIINSGLLESGTPIKIALESNSLFNIQTKTLVGTHLDYKFNDNFVIGGTILHLSERPLTQKVNIGDEPISNTIWGLNGTYTTKSQFLTNLIDKLPLIQTKEPSSITFEGEFAQLLPGHSKAIKKSGTAYIDDFEGSETSYEMKSYPAWSLASIPQGQPDLFRNADKVNSQESGYNRAKLAWYVIDPLFTRNSSATPNHLKNDESKLNPFVREIDEQEIFTKKSNPTNLPSKLQILNLAFYPTERGPYNYDLDVETTGKLKTPTQRWGGIMREVLTSDFEAANVQFIEFWVMDPFVLDSLRKDQGKLYFNLGDISEDVLKDSRKSFENGFSKDGNTENVDTTVWGVVPDITSQAITNSFDNDPDSRKYQDIGLDGLSDQQEASFFSNFITSLSERIQGNPQALEAIKQDPSSDDFHYYRGGDYDEQRLSVLDRYKKYNGYENNSPALESNTDVTASGTSLPNSEDINRDNTLSESENYYQYSVDISRSAMKEVGKNYITDIVEQPITFKDKPLNVKWFQFRIPITEPERVVGSIQDFKSIRFMRMFLRGFEDSVILRFAKLELVRGEWRKYDFSMKSGGEGNAIPEQSDGTFEISSVNIEENSQKSPVNYVLPPGIDRVIDPQNPQLTQLNEQSMVLKVQDLVNGDARAAYKTMSLDVRQYKRLQMEVHAEKLAGGTPLSDDELTLFIRMGSDYKNNYYEIEVPLKLTPAGSYEDNDEDRLKVWPEENRIDFSFEDFQTVKQARNNMMDNSGSAVTFSSVFPYKIDGSDYNYYICGNPNLSNVRTMMIGVRYPLKGDAQGTTRSAEVWVNELRLTNFNEKGGWAANGRIITKLADLGTVSIAGSTLKPGFGSIDQKINERSKEEINSYDLAASLELGKFFPEKWGVQIPMYVSYSESFTDPEYNPIDPDIPLKVALDNASSERERDSILNIARDYVMRRSLNFTNVRINKQSGKPHFYDISNWTFNYAFNETYGHNINTQRSIDKRFQGGIMYSYNARPKTVQPFSKVNFLNGKAFRLIKDFNFNLGPSSVGFRTDMSRYYREVTLRDINSYGIVVPTVSKDFLWNRNYDFSYDLTRSIRIDFNASNIARIDEPVSVDVINRHYKNEYELWKDSVWHNIKNLGRTTQYYHDINISYTLPINKLPLLDWTSSSIRYSATYGWDAGPTDPISADLGNSIKNSNTLQFNTQFTLTTLYNKIPYFKRLLQPPAKNAQKKKNTKKVIYERSGMVLKSEEARVIFHKLATQDVVVKFFDKDNKEIKGKTEIINENRISFQPDSNVNNARVLVEGTVEVNPSPFTIIVEAATKFLLGVKNVSFSYSQTQGTLLPGYLPKTKFLGMEELNGIYAPGLPFILGYQDKDFARKAALDHGWVSQSPNLNSPFVMTHNETFNGRANLEPLPGFKIELTVLRTYSRNENSYWINTDASGTFPDSLRGFTRDGNFSMSFISIGSAFEHLTSKNYENSPTFEKFKNNRYKIMARLADDRKKLDPNYDSGSNVDGQFDGYNEYSQQVLIPAFLSAYGGMNAKDVTLKDIPSYLLMRPNWRVTFDGISKLEFVKKFARNVSISHSYKSTYNIGSYLSNPDFFTNVDIETGLSNLRDLQNNFIGPYEINSVSINEQFGPLINVDITWKNSLLTRFELRKSRNVNLSLSSYQVTETNNNDIIIGSGYKFKDVQFIIKSAGGQKPIKSDLNLTADISFRDNKVIVRKLDGVAQAAQGQNVITIKFAADYNLSESFNLRFFYDRIVNKPFTSISYPTANTNVGFSVRFTLVQ
jgi:cell surface protein SprA